MDHDFQSHKILRVLGERMKELAAIHKTANILQDDTNSISVQMIRIVNLLQDAWQYPEYTAARIKFQDDSYTTNNFKKTEWRQKAVFSLHSGEAGSIEVYYLRSMPELFEGPFLAEERELINTLAEMLRLFFQHKLDEKDLQSARDNLEKLVDERTRKLSETNNALQEKIAEYETARAKIANYQRQLQKLASELSLAEARERRKIASELHDYIGQSLAFMKIKLLTLGKELQSSESATTVDEVKALLDETIQYTRDLTSEISPPVLYELGLQLALEWLVEQFAKKHGLLIDLNSAIEEIKLQEELEIVLFTSVQELLNNIAKHANSENVRIILTLNSEYINVEVHDDGMGFDSRALESGSSEDWGFGLFNIKERLTYLGGSFKIDSHPNSGTRAILSAPYKR